MEPASARSSALLFMILGPAGAAADRYFSECVWSEKVGKTELEDGERTGTKDSSGPREGVVALSTPDGAAVKNVPLPHLRQSECSLRKAWRATDELVRSETTLSLPLNLEITQT